MAKLVLQRQKNLLFSVGDTVFVFLDEVQIGSLRNGERLEYTLTDGEDHTVRFKSRFNPFTKEVHTIPAGHDAEGYITNKFPNTYWVCHWTFTPTSDYTGYSPAPKSKPAAKPTPRPEPKPAPRPEANPPLKEPVKSHADRVKEAAENLTHAFAVSWLKNAFCPGGVVTGGMAQDGHRITKVVFQVQRDRLHTMVYTAAGLSAPFDELYADLVDGGQPYLIPDPADQARIQQAVLDQLRQEAPYFRIVGNTIHL